VKKEKLEGYFVHRLATDNVETGDMKGIEKGERLVEAGHVTACSVHMTSKDVYLSGMVKAAMKKKVRMQICAIHGFFNNINNILLLTHYTYLFK
jgi:hypothetical protein